MPIKPENKHRYPPDWPAIVERIRKRAGNQCENCGAPNHALGGRLDGVFFKASPKGEKLLRLEYPKPGEEWWCEGVDICKLRIFRIVCTTAHLDHTPENCDEDNLRYWCQKCHLSYDAKHHAATARATRHARKAIGDMFDVDGAR